MTLCPLMASKISILPYLDYYHLWALIVEERFFISVLEPLFCVINFPAFLQPGIESCCHTDVIFYSFFLLHLLLQASDQQAQWRPFSAQQLLT